MPAALLAANPKSALEDLVNKMWGEEEGAYLLGFASKWGIDLDKLIERLKHNGQNVYTGIGAIETMGKANLTVVQCTCGDVFELDSRIVEPLRKMYRDHRLRCPGCDHESLKKVSTLTGKSLVILTSSDIMELQKRAKNLGIGSPGPT